MAVGIAVHYIMQNSKYAFLFLGTESAVSCFVFSFLWSFVCVVLTTAGDEFYTLLVPNICCSLSLAAILTWCIIGHTLPCNTVMFSFVIHYHLRNPNIINMLFMPFLTYLTCVLQSLFTFISILLCHFTFHCHNNCVFFVCVLVILLFHLFLYHNVLPPSVLTH